jgi:hypothetical protein
MAEPINVADVRRVKEAKRWWAWLSRGWRWWLVVASVAAPVPTIRWLWGYDFTGSNKIHTGLLQLLGVGFFLLGVTDTLKRFEKPGAIQRLIAWAKASGGRVPRIRVVPQEQSRRGSSVRSQQCHRVGAAVSCGSHESHSGSGGHLRRDYRVLVRKWSARSWRGLGRLPRRRCYGQPGLRALCMGLCPRYRNRLHRRCRRWQCVGLEQRRVLPNQLRRGRIFAQLLR